MYHVARMYSVDQWQFDQIVDVIKFFYSDEIHHNNAIVVEQKDNGIRAWIGTDFLQIFEGSYSAEVEEMESWVEFDVIA